MSKIEERLQELGLTLPPAPPKGGIYSPIVVSGNMLYISGQPPAKTDGTLITGVVGKDLTIDQGFQAAKQTGLTMLATIKEHFGDLDNIRKLVKSLGMVNCEPGFHNQPQVINGYSQLMLDVFDKEGLGARSAVGMMLPGNIAVEIEAIWELK